MSDSPVFFRDAKTIESLNRILERFVVSANAYIKNNFQGHPEAHVNPYLLTEYVSDMAVAAQLYAKINGGKSLYAVATKRGDGTAQPAVPQLRRTIVGARDDGEVDLLTALEHNRSIIQRSATERAAGGLLSGADDV